MSNVLSFLAGFWTCLTLWYLIGLGLRVFRHRASPRISRANDGRVIKLLVAE